MSKDLGHDANAPALSQKSKEALCLIIEEVLSGDAYIIIVRIATLCISKHVTTNAILTCCRAIIVNAACTTYNTNPAVNARSILEK